MTLSTLPKDLQGTILSYLPKQDLFRTARTSKPFHKLLDNDQVDGMLVHARNSLAKPLKERKINLVKMKRDRINSVNLKICALVAFMSAIGFMGFILNKMSKDLNCTKTTKNLNDCLSYYEEGLPFGKIFFIGVAIIIVGMGVENKYQEEAWRKEASIENRFRKLID